MEIQELHNLSEEDIKDLTGLMAELTDSIAVTPEMLEAAAGDPSTHLFTAIEDGRIIGTATLCITHSPTGRKGGIEDVVVSSDFRGLHIGRMLMEHIISYARQEYAPVELHLTSRPSREKANLLYQALGFRRHETNVYKLPIFQE